MNSIVVCIPTYKRPLMLKNLILSIAGCKLDGSLINKLCIIIVDNDTDRTAESTVSVLRNEHIDLFEIVYFNYSEKGLSNVRNVLLKKAFEINTDFIVFIDDDEYASQQWLNELVSTAIQNKGDMVVGPVISVFEEGVPESIAYWFQRPDHQNNMRISFIATNNLIIRTSSLIKNNIWFDKRFNKTGAEDSYFGIQMFKQGSKAFWAQKAIVYETVPMYRANILWLIKRYYNAANTYTYILKIEKEYIDIVKKIIISLFYIFSGLITCLAIPLPIKKRYWGLLKLSEGVGSLAALFSIKYNEYE